MVHFVSFDSGLLCGLSIDADAYLLKKFGVPGKKKKKKRPPDPELARVVSRPATVNISTHLPPTDIPADPSPYPIC